jgi:AraC-like DNA-binding protein
MHRLDINNRREWRRLAEQSGYRAGALARILQISRRQLQRYTRLAFGLSPQAWLDQERLEIAPNMLKQTRCVKITAFNLGFKQVSHFSREFRLRYGIPPSGFVLWSDQELVSQFERGSSATRRGAEVETDAPLSSCPLQITDVRPE